MLLKSKTARHSRASESRHLQGAADLIIALLQTHVRWIAAATKNFSRAALSPRFRVALRTGGDRSISRHRLNERDCETRGGMAAVRRFAWATSTCGGWPWFGAPRKLVKRITVISRSDRTETVTYLKREREQGAHLRARRRGARARVFTHVLHLVKLSRARTRPLPRARNYTP